jgi:hypothetical protein
LNTLLNSRKFIHFIFPGGMGNSSSSAQVPPPPRFVLTAPTLARLEGVLLGMAIGDFVGAYVEGNSPAESAAAVDRIALCVREQVWNYPFANEFAEGLLF